MAYRWHAWKDGLTAIQIQTVYEQAHQLCGRPRAGDYSEEIARARGYVGWLRRPLVGLLRDWQEELYREGAADGRASVGTETDYGIASNL